MRFKRELTALEFGNRVIRPGDIQHGFLYMKWDNYQAVRLNILDITDNKVYEVRVPIVITSR